MDAQAEGISTRSSRLRAQSVRDGSPRVASRTRLLPALLRGTGARVVSVTSTGRHVGATVDPDNLHLVRRYAPWRAYGQSKPANVHLAVELDRRFREAGVPARSIVVHPGFTNRPTGAQCAGDGGWPEPTLLPRRRSAGRDDPGPGCPLAAAGGDRSERCRGRALYTPRWVNWGPPVRRPMFWRTRDLDAMARLWEVSERETGISFDVKPA